MSELYGCDSRFSLARDAGNRSAEESPASECYQRTNVPWYNTMMSRHLRVVERVQTGVRMEKRILKVLKGFAEYHDLTLGDLLEGIVLHAFDGKNPLSAESLARIQELKKFYELDLDSSDSHQLEESSPFKGAQSGPRESISKGGR
jgi:hypothetical protein